MKKNVTPKTKHEREEARVRIVFGISIIILAAIMTFFGQILLGTNTLKPLPHMEVVH